MENNIYDNESFFGAYAGMTRSREGLAGAGEWPAFKRMLPEFFGRDVLDLGCGYGWHCAYAASQGARSVLGIDSSERMLAEARRRHACDAVEYRHVALEEYDYPPESFDMVLSSLALHYVEDICGVFRGVFRTLRHGGVFVFSVEHPVFTAYGTQEWMLDAEGNIMCWPVDRYFSEGRRDAHFLGETVVKYHHTLTTLLHGLVETGFTVCDVVEPEPTGDMLRRFPEMENEARRPMMIIVSALRP